VKHWVSRFCPFALLENKGNQAYLHFFVVSFKVIFSFEVLIDGNVWVLLSRVSNDPEFHQKVSGVLIESNGANNNLQGQY
jgi:hypothetical protein